ncbi:hypothetical protein V6N11_027133 [Hibiscus sabdariffa]|uniref:SAUR-like auxin-responsive protein family n=1 Tax=Hibiscus sabdariffa TaxID=183260 RepID=A0ABR2PG23_9ROSI
MSEEECGLSSDSAVMNYLVSLVKRGLAKDLEKAKASMVSTKRLIKMAGMWKKIDAIGRKRITSPRSSTGRETANPDRSNKSSVVDKGHFIVSTSDKKRSDEKRFVLPFEYLKNIIVMELFQMAEEEFGLEENEHLTLPCDAALMEYVIGLIKRKASKQVEKALIMSVVSMSVMANHPSFYLICNLKGKKGQTMAAAQGKGQTMAAAQGKGQTMAAAPVK